MGARFSKRFRYSSRTYTCSESNSSRRHRSEKPKKLKTIKNKNIKNNCDEAMEFKFILHDILHNNSISLNSDTSNQDFNNFINSFKNGKIQQAALLDDYYTQLDCLTYVSLSNLNPNKMLAKFVRATCFTRDQEAACTKLYIKLKKQSTKGTSLFISIDDIFISSLEAISIETCGALLDYLKEHLMFKEYTQEINRLYHKRFLFNSSSSDEELYPSFTTVKHVNEASEYLTALDSFTWKHLQQFKNYLHISDRVDSRTNKATLIDSMMLIHKLINSGFKINNYFYDEQKLYKYNILFLIYYNVHELCLFKEKEEEANLGICLNYCLKSILTLVKIDGFKKNSDDYRNLLYYKLKKCTFQKWTDENKLLISELITINKKPLFKPLSLADISRKSIRNHCSNEAIGRLDLPKRLINFLRFEEDIEQDTDLYFQILY